ncbi:MAG: molecular chaperone GrpE, partial [Candidatus Berkelbacteria bacterium Athens1014_28]
MEKNLKKKIKELEKNILEMTTGWQRTQADFSNYKKQIADEKLHLVKFANADIVEQLLPVLDHFQLATKHLPDELKSNNWAIGIKQIEKQFESILFENGL